MRREMGTRTFYDESLPPWNCPSCGIGRLEIAKSRRKANKGALLSITAVDANTTAMQKEFGNYPYPEGVFATILGCNRGECEEHVAISGTWWMLETMVNGEQDMQYVHYVEHVTPALHFFNIPAKCPKKIIPELVSAFSLYWCDPKSCLNRIRATIELLLTRMKVPPKPRLHDRILELGKSKPELADHLMAVKWLGNAGSHTSPASDDDALDGFEILEHVLKESFDPINRLSTSINRRKGPIRRKKK